MFTYLLGECKDCDKLQDALCSIDGILAKFGKNAWQNTSFLTDKPVPLKRIRQLIYYKEILTHLRWNQEFYCPYFFPKIVSRVLSLTGGECNISRGERISSFTTTTSTTTGSDE